MSDAIRLQQQALLDLVDNYWQEACGQLLAQATDESEEMVKTAEKEAKQRKKAAKEASKQRKKQILAAARAQQSGELRQVVLKDSQALLQHGHQLLEQALLTRWHNADQRKCWIRFLLERANRLLPSLQDQGVVWQIIHSADWQRAELQNCGVEIDAASMERAVYQVEDRVVAGLRIGCHGVWVDGTLQGITANQQENDALLLALLQPQREGES